jgi:hypothetical protein
MSGEVCGSEGEYIPPTQAEQQAYEQGFKCALRLVYEKCGKIIQVSNTMLEGHKRRDNGFWLTHGHRNIAIDIRQFINKTEADYDKRFFKNRG